MRGLHYKWGWVELEDYPEASAVMQEPVWSIKDDPEAGSFTECDFEEMQP